ncbi:carbon storage regulator [Isoptericola sp. NEAU-Y5]|uniref:Translational regulator CsrA n=1 Tax=Isoptericola luteus TaxID=2879484 RepID=A0ABS7ZML0_9MICO|nr:carbon storage regulator [Isoptericola sp. NEAU-Y5]MCA5895114.1 carbon storage regulator [Isoptericola sp. NEAU-Y5]
MLVLGRKAGDKILIGDDVVVTIVSAGKDGVRIGIDAPDHLRIHRAEIVDQVAAVNRAATADAGAVNGARALLGLRPAAPGASPRPADGRR